MTDVLDKPPAGWFPLNVMRASDGRKWDWVALMVDVHSEELKHCHCKTAFLYVHRTITNPMAPALRKRHWFACPASIATRMPPGTLCTRSSARRGIEIGSL
jgi:hypothetical protein